MPSHQATSSVAPRSGRPVPQQSKEGRDYLSLKLDDPSFTAPIFVNLFDDPDSEVYTLVCSRCCKKDGE
jgi:uncharacterized protein (DUF736 family)